MTVNLTPKRWSGRIREVILGAGSRESRTVGGGNDLPLHAFEAGFAHRPILALEITDTQPPRWPAEVCQPWNEVFGKPGEAARMAAEQYGAEAVMLNLWGTHPDRGDRSAEQAERDVGAVLEAVKLPVIVKGPGAGAKQNDVLARVAEAYRGEGLVLHSACQEDYKTLAAATVAYEHVLVAESPIDLNIAKQLNILLSESNVEIGRVLIDPLTGGLGYGLEYTYSVMERIRLAALGGDAMLACPVICLVGEETWRVKEVRVSAEEQPLFGDQRLRGIHWEVVTALSLLLAGAELLVLRHPESRARLRALIDAWFGGEGDDRWR